MKLRYFHVIDVTACKRKKKGKKLDCSINTISSVNSFTLELKIGFVIIIKNSEKIKNFVIVYLLETK